MEYLMIAHKLLMGIATLLAIAAGLIAYQKKGNWLAKHRIIAVLASFMAIIAFAAVAVFKNNMNYPHFLSAHSLVGLAAIAFLIVACITGKLKTSGLMSIGKTHAYCGRLALITSFFATATGAAKYFKAKK